MRVRHLFVLSTAAIASLTGGCEYVSPTGDVSQPFEGPGFTLDAGLTAQVPDSGVFVVGATRLVVADGDEPMSLFNERMPDIAAAIEAAPPGLVGYSLRQNLFSREYRTVSVWESQDAMWAFVLSDAHFAAIEDADRIQAEGSRVVQFTVSPEELPPRWDMVIEKTDTDGRSSY